MQKQLCVITGANGFVGNHLSQYLAAKELNLRKCVRVAEDFNEFSTGNLADFSNWDELFKDATSVVHLMAKVHDMTNPPAAEYFKYNSELTKKIAEEAKKQGVKKFIFLSSIKVNGEYTLNHLFTADDTPRPEDPYGQSKLQAEQELLKLHEDGVFEVTIIRSPLVYGPNVRANFNYLVNLVLKKIPLPFGNVNNKRSLVSVYNLNDLIYTCLTNPKSSGQIFLASDDEDLSLTDLIKKIARTNKVNTYLVPIPQNILESLLSLIGKKNLATRLLGNLQLDITKTKNVLNWRPLLTTEQSLQKMAHEKKLHVMRVVTAPEAVHFHLRNTLRYSKELYRISVVGTDVNQFKKTYPWVDFIDLKIERKINLLQDLKSVFLLIKILFKNSPDVVHSIMPKSGLVTALAGFIARTPVRIHSFTGQTWANMSGAKKTLLVTLDQLVVALNTICFTDSASQSHFLKQNYITKNNQALPVIHKGSINGVDLQRFNTENISPNSTAIRGSLNIKQDHFVFIFLGRKCTDKGIFELIQAFDKLNKVINSISLLLVGPDESNGQLEKVLAHLQNSNIKNLPATEEPEINLNASDVFCLPSYREGFGTVIIEAAALKKPAVASRITGIMDAVIENETGLLVEVKNVEDLYLKMKLIFEDKNLYTKLAQQAQKNVNENFEAEKLARLLFEEYKKLRQ